MTQSPFLFMKENSKTVLWNDSADPKELKDALTWGIVGATCNPVIALSALKADQDYWVGRIKEYAKSHPTSTDDEIGWAMVKELSINAAKLLEGEFEKYNGRNGRLSIQTDPRNFRNAKALTEQAFEFSKIAKNIIVKIPVTTEAISAFEEATYLAKLCTKVTMLVRRDEMRASKAMQKRVFNTDNITVLFNHETKSINGEKGVESVTAFNNQTQEETVIPATGFFVAIGHKPNTDIFKGQLEMDDNGYLIVEPGTSKTQIPGVFAAGDVADHVYRQAVTSAGTGCMAALDAERFLAAQE